MESVAERKTRTEGDARVPQATINFVGGLRGRALHHALLALIVFPAFTMLGYNQGVAGGLVTLPSWIQTFPSNSPNTVTPAQDIQNARIRGTVVAIYTGAGTFGSLACVFLGDRLGRRRTILLGATAALVGAVLQTCAYSLAQLVVGRVVAGLGVGCVVATVPNWQSECSSARKRGGVVVMEGMFAMFGLAFMAWIELGMSYVAGSASWRVPMALSALWPLMIMFAVPLVPESPRWLVLVNRQDEARSTLATLEDIDASSPEIQTVIHTIHANLQLSGRLGFQDAFKMGDRRFFHRLCICCLVQIFQQICGINALGYYETTVFIQIGVSATDARILAAAVFTLGMLVTPIGVFVVDKFGRRPLMLLAVFGMGCCGALMAGCESLPHNKTAQGFASLGVFLYSCFFPIGLMGVTFLYAAEIAPLSLRVPITAISTSMKWAFNFMTVEVAPVGYATIGWKFYIIWAVLNLALMFPCIYFFFPETRGLSLEAIDQIFIQSKNIFQPVWVAKQMRRNLDDADPFLEGGAEEEGQGADSKEKEDEVKNKTTAMQLPQN